MSHCALNKLDKISTSKLGEKIQNLGELSKFDLVQLILINYQLGKRNTIHDFILKISEVINI